MKPRWTALALLLCLGCAGLPPARDAVGVSHLLPLADPMGPGDTALGLCVGAISERGALLKSCDDLDFLLRDEPHPATVHAAPEYRRELVDSSIGARNAYLQLGARYAWSVERVVRSSRRLAWRPEEQISDEEIEAIAGACRGAARGGHLVVAEYHGCGVVVSSGDLSVTPPRALEQVFEAKLAKGEFESRGGPRGFLLLSPDRRERDFHPGSAHCTESATLLVKTRSLADLCLERVPGLVARASRRRQEALFARIGSLELKTGELRTMLDGCRDRGEELTRRLDDARLANAELRAAEGEAQRRLAVANATRAADARRGEQAREELTACRESRGAAAAATGAADDAVSAGE